MHLQLNSQLKVHHYLNNNVQWIKRCNVYWLEFILNNSVPLREIIIICYHIDINGEHPNKCLLICFWICWEKWKFKLLLKNKLKSKLFFHPWYLNLWLFQVVYWSIKINLSYFLFISISLIKDKILKI